MLFRSIWDESVFGGTITPFARWQPTLGLGHYGSYQIKTVSKSSDIRFYAIDYVIEGGGIL